MAKRQKIAKPEAEPAGQALGSEFVSPWLTAYVRVSRGQ